MCVCVFPCARPVLILSAHRARVYTRLYFLLFCFLSSRFYAAIVIMNCPWLVHDVSFKVYTLCPGLCTSCCFLNRWKYIIYEEIVSTGDSISFLARHERHLRVRTTYFAVRRSSRYWSVDIARNYWFRRWFDFNFIEFMHEMRDKDDANTKTSLLLSFYTRKDFAELRLKYLSRRIGIKIKRLFIVFRNI